MASLQTFSLGFIAGRREGTLPGFVYCRRAVCQASWMHLPERMSKTVCLANFIVGFCSTKHFQDICLANAIFVRIQP